MLFPQSDSLCCLVFLQFTAFTELTAPTKKATELTVKSTELIALGYALLSVYYMQHNTSLKPEVRAMRG